MPRAKVDESEVLDTVAVEDGGSERKRRPRISIILNEDGSGKADIERIKPEMQERIRAFLSDKDNLAAFGLGAEEQSAIVEFKDEAINAMLSAMEKIEAFGALFGGVPLDIGLRYFVFNDKQRDALRQPMKNSLQRLAVRYPWLFQVAKNQDVVIIAFIVTTQFIACYKGAKAEAGERARAQAEAEALAVEQGAVN